MWESFSDFKYLKQNYSICQAISIRLNPVIKNCMRSQKRHILNASITFINVIIVIDREINLDKRIFFLATSKANT